MYVQCVPLFWFKRFKAKCINQNTTSCRIRSQILFLLNFCFPQYDFPNFEFWDFTNLPIGTSFRKILQFLQSKQSLDQSEHFGIEQWEFGIGETISWNLHWFLDEIKSLGKLPWKYRVTLIICESIALITYDYQMVSRIFWLYESTKLNVVIYIHMTQE